MGGMLRMPSLPSQIQLVGLSLLAGLFLACGNPVDFPIDEKAPNRQAPPQRVIVIGPATTETLFAMGLGDRVIGVSDYCDLPAADHLPRVGGLFNPNLERIASLKPDHVIVEGQSQILRELALAQGFGLENASIASRELWINQVNHLGALFQSPAGALQLLAKVNGQLRRTERRNRPQDSSKRPKVLIVINRDFDQASKMLVAGGGSFLSELVEIAGAINLFAETEEGVFDLNTESLVRNPPEIILEFDTNPTARATQPNSPFIWGRDWPAIPAVKNNQILTLVGRHHLVPGPRMAETARDLAVLFHKKAPSPLKD